MKRFLIALFIIALIPLTAHARVDLPEDFIATMGFGNCGLYVDGCRLASGQSAISDNEIKESYYWTMVDGASIGINAFFLDATSNLSNFVWKLKAMNKAARQYNSEHPSDKICIGVMYEQSTSGALAMFDAADADDDTFTTTGGATSPLCTLEDLPLVGVWGNGTCVDPTTQISARGPFNFLATVWNISGSIPPQSCVDTWKSHNVDRVLTYAWMSGDFNAIATEAASTAKKAAIIATGAEPVMGIGSARAENCGDAAVCAGSKSSTYTLHDPNGFNATILSFKRATESPGFDKIMYTMSHPGDYGENSSMEGGIICDAHDQVPHNVTIGGVNTNFTCPNIPDYLRGSIPSGGNYVSYDTTQWARRGNWRIARTLKEIFKTGNPPSNEKYVAWTYRQHPYSLSGTGTEICPTANTTLHSGSMSGKNWGDNIWITSMGSGIKLRVRVGSTVLYENTLPTDLLTATSGERQIAIPWGTVRGRPVFEILDANNNVTQSQEGDVEYTNTPKQRSGKTGRNLSMYSNFMPLETATPRATLEQLDSSVNEGDSGISYATFRITLDSPAVEQYIFRWNVTSSTAGTNDFYYLDASNNRVMPTGAVAIPIGSQTVDIQVPINGDTTAETDEQFTLTIKGDIPIDVAYVTGTIINDDDIPAGTTSTCISDYTDPSQVPPRYSYPWDVLFNNRTILRAINCGVNNTSGTLEVGRDTADIYVYKYAYYWDGNNWISVPLTGSATNGDWIIGKATSVTQVPFNNLKGTFVSAAICTKLGDGDYKCGCRDGSCVGRRWTLQVIRSRTGTPTDVGQCGAPPPPAAAAAGLTNQVFCDDFSDATKSFDFSSALWNENVKWGRKLPFNYTSPNQASYKFSNGVLTLNPNVSAAQLSFLTTQKTASGQIVGFKLDHVKEWYAEIKWKHVNTSAAKGFPAFWAMDNSHLWQGGANFIEPDFFEYISLQQVTATHDWTTSGGKAVKKTSCQRVVKDTSFDPTKWHTNGIHVNANDYDGSIDYYLNDTKLIRYDQTSVCKAQTGPGATTSPAFLKNLKNGSFPIMVGTGVGYPIDIDYIRVFTK